jgi:hypothetical protein
MGLEIIIIIINRPGIITEIKKDKTCILMDVAKTSGEKCRAKGSKI